MRRLIYLFFIFFYFEGFFYFSSFSFFHFFFQADLYSLGIILFEMTKGFHSHSEVPPFFQFPFTNHFVTNQLPTTNKTK